VAGGIADPDEVALAATQVAVLDRIPIVRDQGLIWESLPAFKLRPLYIRAAKVLRQSFAITSATRASCSWSIRQSVACFRASSRARCRPA